MTKPVSSATSRIADSKVSPAPDDRWRWTSRAWLFLRLLRQYLALAIGENDADTDAGWGVT